MEGVWHEQGEHCLAVAGELEVPAADPWAVVAIVAVVAAAKLSSTFKDQHKPILEPLRLRARHVFRSGTVQN